MEIVVALEVPTNQVSIVGINRIAAAGGVDC